MIDCRIRNEWIRKKRKREHEEKVKNGSYCNLDIWSDYKYTQNEITSIHEGGIRSRFKLENTPVVKGSTTFTIYIGRTAVQVGHIKNDGTFVFIPLGVPEIYAVEGGIDLKEGIVGLRFNKPAGPNNIVVSYEASLECQQWDL